MHQIAFGGRAPSGPAGGAYSAPPDLLAGLGELTSKGRDGKGVGAQEKRGWEGEGGRWEEEGEGRGEKEELEGRGRRILDTPLQVRQML